MRVERTDIFTPNRHSGASVARAFARGRDQGSLQYLDHRDGLNVMFQVVETGQISLLRDLVRTHDPEAHMVVMDAVEFYGGAARVG